MTVYKPQLNTLFQMPLLTTPFYNLHIPTIAKQYNIQIQEIKLRKEYYCLNHTQSSLRSIYIYIYIYFDNRLSTLTSSLPSPLTAKNQNHIACFVLNTDYIHYSVITLQ